MSTFKPFALKNDIGLADRQTFFLAVGVAHFRREDGTVDSEELVIDALHVVGLSYSPRDWANHLATKFPEVLASTIEIKPFNKSLWDDVVEGRKDHVSWDGRDVQVCLTSEPSRVHSSD